MPTVFNTGSGNWQATTTWNPAVAPSAADNVVLNFFNANNPGANYQVGLDGTGTALNLTVLDHNTLNIFNSSSPFGGQLTIGELLLIGSGGTVSGIGDLFAHSIQNGGTIEGTEFFPLVIHTDTPLVNSGQLLADAGNLTVIGGLDNSGTVHASNHHTMKLGSVSNSGQLVATGFTSEISVQGSLDNSGQVDAIHEADISVHGIVTNSGTVLAQGDFFVSKIEFFASVTNSGQMEANPKGELDFHAGVTNKSGGQLIDDGGTIRIDGAATGGIALIEGSGSLLAFDGSATQDTTMNAVFGGAGKLALNHSANYAGSVSNFALGDSIDVTDVGFVSGKDSYNQGTNSLTVGGTHIQLLGSYTANDFLFESDGHGGTMIIGQAAHTAIV
ncbi:MAG: hypothetical protein ACLPSW_07870 [Roseiarcus sp.]